MTDPDFAPPMPAIAAIDAPMIVRRASMTCSTLIANIAVASVCLVIIAMGIGYGMAGTP